MKKAKINHVIYDWKEDSSDEWTTVLKDFGLYVYGSPMCEGSDQYGYIVSNEPLTKAQIKKYEAEEFGIEYDENS